MKDTRSELSFNTFCGLHYTSDSDVNKFSDNLDSFKNKSFILNTYVNYFTNICCAMFKIKGLPKEIDEQFVIRTLINRGSIAFFKTTINKRIRDNRTGEYKDEKIELANQICEYCDANLVRIIGNVAILYKPAEKEDDRKIILD